MSHITKMKLKITSRAGLENALKTMGYTINSTKTTVKDYSGNKEDVDIVLKEHDTIGFRKSKDGTWEYVGDFYGTGVNQKEFMHQLASEYTLTAIKKKLRSNGMHVAKTVRENDKIKLRVYA